MTDANYLCVEINFEELDNSLTFPNEQNNSEENFNYENIFESRLYPNIQTQQKFSDSQQLFSYYKKSIPLNQRNSTESGTWAPEYCTILPNSGQNIREQENNYNQEHYSDFMQIEEKKEIDENDKVDTSQFLTVSFSKSNETSSVKSNVKKSITPNSKRILEKDGMFKKFKTHSWDFIRKDLIKKINKKYPKNPTCKKKLQIKKLPNEECTSNIKISFNKRILKKKMTIFDIFSKFWGKIKKGCENMTLDVTTVKKEVDYLNYMNNISTLEKIMSISSNTELKEYISITYEEYIKLYLVSNAYKYDIKKIKKNHCEKKCQKKNGKCKGYCNEYIDRFILCIEGNDSELGILDYFLKTKPNAKKDCKREKTKTKKQPFKAIKNLIDNYSNESSEDMD